ILQFPGQSPDVRVDTGFRAGDDVTIYYDPMIAKVICHGETRDVAIERTLATLDAIDVGERVTNLDFLRATIDNAEFRAGRVFTGFIDHHKTSLLQATRA
ncbi:MAG: acetyl-CoA carboxylase biotin carboxylase subunit, partial [Casimicrobiaceae bacterium]